jgi:hypothetical protein
MLRTARMNKKIKIADNNFWNARNDGDAAWYNGYRVAPLSLDAMEVNECAMCTVTT